MSDAEKEPEPVPTVEETNTPKAATEGQEDGANTEEVKQADEPTEAAASTETAELSSASDSKAAPTETAEVNSASGSKEEAEEKKEPEVESKESSGAKESADEIEEVAAEPEPEPIVIPEGNGELVLVTGATGYLGSHIVKHLVESEQFKVRGTVRTIEGNEKLDKLKSLLGESKYEVEFVEADLTKPETWAEAVKGCEYVIHTANPFPVTEPADANEVINPTKEGVLSILKASVESATVKRVVLTSSLVTIVGGQNTHKTCDEDTFAEADKIPNTYDKSKTIAEKAALDFIKNELPEGSNLELSVVNPGFMVGPPLMKMDCTSVEVLKKLMNREYTVLPKISFACTDVRDVALAHMRAMVIKQAAGHRHIVCKSSVWLKDMANILSQEFSSQGFNIATSETHYIVVRIKSYFDPEIKRILPDVGKMYTLDTKRMTEVLQVEPREVKDSLLEMGHSLINLEIVQKVEKPEKKPRKMTFRKKKAKIDDEEEKKDEPEKAASTSGSAENESVPDATIEDVVIAEDAQPAESQKTETEEVKVTSAEAAVETPEVKAEPEEVKAEADEEKTADTTGAQSEEEVKDEASGTSDPESTKKKDKKEKPKKEKKEKKKGGLFSFSFKKNKKPTVEKKTEEAAADETLPADETTTEEPTAATEESSAATEETPAKEEVPVETAPEATEDKPTEAASAVAAEETAEAAPAVTEDTPADTTPEAKETPAAEEKTTEEPASNEESASS